MTSKMKLKDTSWVVKVGVIGGWLIVIVYIISFIIGFTLGILGI